MRIYLSACLSLSESGQAPFTTWLLSAPFTLEGSPRFALGGLRPKQDEATGAIGLFAPLTRLATVDAMPWYAIPKLNRVDLSLPLSSFIRVRQRPKQKQLLVEEALVPTGRFSVTRTIYTDGLAHMLT